MRKFIYALVWWMSTPLRFLMFFRKWSFVQNFAIDFFELTNIKEVVAKAVVYQQEYDEKEHQNEIRRISKRYEREAALDTSKFEGVIKNLHAKIAKIKAREDEADYKLYVAKTIMKECIKNATMLVAEAHELGEVCIKVDAKGDRLKSIFQSMAKRLQDVSEGKRVKIESHEG